MPQENQEHWGKSVQLHGEWFEEIVEGERVHPNYVFPSSTSILGKDGETSLRFPTRRVSESSFQHWLAFWRSKHKWKTMPTRGLNSAHRGQVVSNLHSKSSSPMSAVQWHQNDKREDLFDWISKRITLKNYLAGSFVQVPIESDEKAVKFALDNALQFIMGASTLRSLLVMPWVNRNQSHSYMIRVRQKLHNGKD